MEKQNQDEGKREEQSAESKEQRTRGRQGEEARGKMRRIKN